MTQYVVQTGGKFLPNITKRRLQSLRRKETDDRYKTHLNAAIMRKDNYTISEIAKDVDVHPATVGKWLRTMEETGTPIIRRKRVGRQPAFTQEQLDQLEREMEDRPSHYGLDSKTWTSRTVAYRAQSAFGINIPHHSLRRILTREGVNWPGSAAAIAARKRGEPYP